MTYGFPGVESSTYDVFEDDVGGLWGLDDATEDRLKEKLDQVDATFSRAYGIAGTRVRGALEQMGPALESAINLFRAKPYSAEAKSWRDAAYAIQYDIKRPELQSSGAAPDWLIDQIRDRVKAFLVTGVAATQPGLVEAAWDVFGPMTPEKAKFIAEQAQKGAKAAGDLTWALIPTWVKVTGAVLGIGAVVGIILAIRSAVPYARGYVEKQTGIRGIGVIGKTKTGRTMVCFKGRRSRRSRRERVCFPARDKRQ
jgi:hypothetical protein